MNASAYSLHGRGGFSGANNHQNDIDNVKHEALTRVYQFADNNPIAEYDINGLHTGIVPGLNIWVFTSRATRGATSEFLHFFHIHSLDSVGLTKSGEISAGNDKWLKVTVNNDPYDVRRMLEIYGVKPIVMGGVDKNDGIRLYPASTPHSESSPDVKGLEFWKKLLILRQERQLPQTITS